MARWIKLYYRDKNGVFRALEGAKMLLGDVVAMEQNVYTLYSQAGRTYWLKVKE